MADQVVYRVKGVDDADTDTEGLHFVQNGVVAYSEGVAYSVVAVGNRYTTKVALLSICSTAAFGTTKVTKAALAAPATVNL